MRRTSLLSTLLLAAALSAAPVAATSYVPISDEALADQAAAVVSATVEEMAAATDADRPVTEYRLKVDRRLKGKVPDTLTVRVPGGINRDGVTLKIWGAPELSPGERVILFLDRHQDGSWQPLHLTLGAFHEVRAGGRTIAVRDLSEMEAASGTGVESSEGTGLARDAAGFARWLGDRSAGWVRQPDYLVKLPAATLESLRGRFTYLGSRKIRWFEFDRNANVTWRAHETGLPGFSGGGFGEIRTALLAWNDDPNSNIRYRYDGTTNNTTGFSSFDGANVVIFEDPNDEAAGTFDCATGGVLAIGGSWFDGSQREPIPIQGADIVVNDGANCWFTTGRRMEEVLAHEAGHTLGLGHSCGGTAGPCNTLKKSEALMRSTAHGDSRGAALKEDDREGIFSLYGQSSGPAKPPAPSGLTATVLSSTSVRLDWTDNSSDETQFRLESKTTGSFREIATPTFNAVTATATGLSAGTTYIFRIRARNAAGFSPYSNEISVTTTVAAQPPAAPANLTAQTASASVLLSWEDRSNNETGFLVERASPTQGFTQLASLPAGSTVLQVGGLPAATPFTFRVRAVNAVGDSAFSNLASASTASGTSGPCTPDTTSLCLAGGRFRVGVQWKTGSGHGNGSVVPGAGTDQTGLFWFFDASNVELIVKVLDGTSVNNFYWTFYGGLSDVEYWITVTDTGSGAVKTYYNPAGSLCGQGDTASFPGPVSPGPPVPKPAVAPVTAVTSAVCSPGTLCLLGGRFQVEVTWKVSPTGPQGAGTPVPIAGSDQTGLFWFFNPENLELVVKVLDGRGVNGKFWVFYGALSDVEYDVKVTDTTIGVTRTYHNNRGNICGGGDTSAF